MTLNFLKAEFHPAYTGTPAMPASIPPRPRTKVKPATKAGLNPSCKNRAPEFKENGGQINLQNDSGNRMIAGRTQIVLRCAGGNFLP